VVALQVEEKGAGHLRFGQSSQKETTNRVHEDSSPAYASQDVQTLFSGSCRIRKFVIHVGRGTPAMTSALQAQSSAT